jgi:hypothetical protein
MTGDRPDLNSRAGTKTPAFVRALLRAAGFAMVAGIACAAAAPQAASAANVSGALITPQGQPAPSRDLHFENRITRDIYLCPTHQDGSFRQNLPPGQYDLRAERGAIVASSIRVTDADLSLGKLTEPSPYSPWRILELEDIAPSLLTSPAPSTAYLMTQDTTVVPASAPLIMQPELHVSTPIATGNFPAAGAAKPTAPETPPASGRTPPSSELPAPSVPPAGANP